MSGGIVFDKTLQMIEDRLTLNSVNQKLISGNLANINTPGYRAKEVSFESALRESLQEQVLQYGSFERQPYGSRMIRSRRCRPRR